MSNKKTHVRKPLEVEAIAWIGSTAAAEVITWAGSHGANAWMPDQERILIVHNGPATHEMRLPSVAYLDVDGTIKTADYREFLEEFDEIEIPYDEVERFTLRYQDDVTGEKREAVICREHLHAFIAAANKAGRKWTTTRALRSRHCVTCALETGGYL